jgi:hypothetical protein
MLSREGMEVVVRNKASESEEGSCSRCRGAESSSLKSVVAVGTGGTAGA